MLRSTSTVEPSADGDQLLWPHGGLGEASDEDSPAAAARAQLSSLPFTFRVLHLNESTLWPMSFFTVWKVNYLVTVTPSQ